MLKLNPKGKLPVFVDGDIVVCESAAIIDYLDDAYPENSFMPKDKAARAKVSKIQYHFIIFELGISKIFRN